MTSQNESYLRMFKDFLMPRILSGLGKLEQEIENSETGELAMRRINEADYIARYLEFPSNQRAIPSVINKYGIVKDNPVLIRKDRYSSLAELLKDFLEQSGIRRNSLSNIADVSYRTIYRFLEEDKVPKLALLRRIFGSFKMDNSTVEAVERMLLNYDSERENG